MNFPAAILLASLLLACGGGAKSPADAEASDDPSGQGAAKSAHGGGCAERVGDAFSKCASKIYSERRYVDVIDACKAAINHTGHSEDDRTYATGICIGLVPSALFHQGRVDEAGNLLAVACKGTTEEQRTNTAARATVITMLGMSHDGDNEQQIKSAVLAFSRACEIPAGQVADRAVELSKE